MRRWIVVTMLCLLVAAACAGPDRVEPGVEVVSSGYSVRDGRLGVAAILRVSAEMQTDIPVTVSFHDADGLVTTERSTLPFCPPSRDCWWGEEYASLGRASRSIRRVEVQAGTGRASQQRRRIVELNVKTSGDRKAVTPVRAGIVYLVIVEDGEPRWGTFFHALGRADEIRSDATLRAGEDMRAFLYVGVRPDAQPGAD